MTMLARPGGSPAPATTSAPPTDAPAPERKGMVEQVALFLFITIPFLALLAAVPFAWGWGLGWHDVVIAAVFYLVAGHGITVGFHRFFTHGSFKAPRWLRVTLALAGSMAIEGPVIRWVADHRKHHAFSDREGDPHSPWRYGETVPALAKGLWWAHAGWLFDRELTPRDKYAPDLMADPDMRRVEAAFPAIVAFSVLAPALIGGLWSMSWQGALTAFFWASILRIGLLHHVTWSINSICHAIGERPFHSRDRSANVWWLAILSMGESWHNLHHADPTCARHGVDRGQLDSSARVIWAFERLGWASDVRWPRRERLETRRVTA
jgi:stearoyl-CoA desaturase (delta-9 desaturase)